jgi:hypothetical protein
MDPPKRRKSKFAPRIDSSSPHLRISSQSSMKS